MKNMFVFFWAIMDAAVVSLCTDLFYKYSYSKADMIWSDYAIKGAANNSGTRCE
jgi:hypothetical protein